MLRNYSIKKLEVEESRKWDLREGNPLERADMG
jgi:hypothetical protein